VVEKFLAALFARVSEDLLREVLRGVIRAIVLNNKKAGIDAAVTELKVVLAEIAVEDMTNDQKNDKLIPVGRDVVKRVRK
jgi:hypothetical protein